MALEEYRKKRDFRRTAEPAGGARRARAEGLEYVIQKHDASRLHYDFRLELGGVFKSWAVPKGPSVKPGVKRLAVETEDHPMEYGAFEGTIPEGQYGGGTVMLWDRGIWVPEGDPEKGYRDGRLRFRLEGEKLYGSWILTRMSPKPDEPKPGWLLIKSDDAAARGEDEPEIVDEAPLSAATGRDLEEIAGAEDSVWDATSTSTSTSKARAGSGSGSRAKSKSMSLDGARRAKMPTDARPQLATLASGAPDGDDWLHEIKLDGYRVLCRVEKGHVRVVTRNGKDWTDRFPGVAEALEGLPCDTAIVDGEIVVLDRKGVSRFQRLQNVASGSSSGRPLLYLFDLLYLDGRDVRDAGLQDRKSLLEPLVTELGDPRIRYSDHVIGQGPDFHAKACSAGVEGIISKRRDRPYRGGRGRSWLKVKCTARQELVVVGYTEPAGSRVGIGALLLGVHDADGRLVYAGKVGTGFSHQTLVELETRLSAMEQTSAPVVNPPRGYRARGVHWVRPELVAEVEFTEWTDDGRIRHPSFQGVREDKEAREVVREGEAGGGGGTAGEGTAGEGTAGKGTVGNGTAGSGRGTGTAGKGTAGRGKGGLDVAGVRVTNAGRVLWEGQGVTKGELAEYYEVVSEVVLPRLVDRPLTLVRCPSGAGGKCFYQKHANESMPDVIPRVTIDEKDGGEPYMYVDGLPALIALVQFGVLELHIWGSRRDRLDRPDRLVFDLDPDEGLPFGRVAAAALRLRSMLEELGLTSFPKTTGGKGLHVVVPLTRRSDWEEARAFAQAVAQRMVAEDPGAFTAKMSKSRRKDRIFVDYLRNAWNATAIADYSTRARPGATVALPITWDEVNPRVKNPPVHTIRDVPGRVASDPDPWPGFDDLRQSITAAARRGVGLD
jgi:bifunctional non-homologous end joining protein LigD